MRKKINKFVSCEIKIVIIVGARPNFIKIAPLFGVFKKYPRIKPILVHTGQHYDFEMSQIFFKGLNIPKPHYNLGIGSGGHAWQTAKMMEKLEPIIIKEKPNLVVVVGDVNSTLAGALTAAKLHIPVGHIEAGMRSYDKNMPEEINRVLTDHVSDFLFVTSVFDKENLLKEGINPKKIFITGNIMTDSLLKISAFGGKNKVSDRILKKFHLENRQYGFFTLHRAENTDNKDRFKKILEAIAEISKTTPIIFPIHPRTKKTAENFKVDYLLKNSPKLKVVPPLSYIDTVSLVKNAKFVLTDSGGLQHETTILGVPCLTIRENTEWPVTIQKGTNSLVGVSRNKIIRKASEVAHAKRKEVPKIKYWDGKTAQRIIKVLSAKLNAR